MRKAYGIQLNKTVLMFFVFFFLASILHSQQQREFFSLNFSNENQFWLVSISGVQFFLKIDFDSLIDDIWV